MPPKANKVIKFKAPTNKTKTIKANATNSLNQATPESNTSTNMGEESGTDAVFFWRETHPDTGYLCQWYACPFRDGDNPNLIYKTAENYMMYQKAVLFGDTQVASEILKTGNPRKVKSLGRKVRNFDEAVWNRERERVVYEGNILKFTTALSEEDITRGNCPGSPLVGESLRALLLSTGDRELVEASPFDRVWGVGFTEQFAEERRDEWGLNLLGKALMRVKEEFRKEDEEREREKSTA